MENRNGDLVSAQISVAGNVDFSGGNFRKDTPFCLKNDGEAAVVLEVNLWGMPEGEFISLSLTVLRLPALFRNTSYRALSKYRKCTGAHTKPR